MRRRQVLGWCGALGVEAVAAEWWPRPSAASGAFPSGAFPFALSDAEWRQRLSPDQYGVLRRAATEYPFTSKLLHEERRGAFTCAGCDQELFSSTTKFDSGTGWPSFWAPLDHAVGNERDASFGVVRTAVHCANCGGHLGHVFSDGPEPTGLRYCMNGVALGFRPATA